MRLDSVSCEAGRSRFLALHVHRKIQCFPVSNPSITAAALHCFCGCLGHYRRSLCCRQARACTSLFWLIAILAISDTWAALNASQVPPKVLSQKQAGRNPFGDDTASEETAQSHGEERDAQTLHAAGWRRDLLSRITLPEDSPMVIAGHIPSGGGGCPYEPQSKLTSTDPREAQAGLGIYLESEWPIKIWSYFVSIMGYFWLW